MSARCSSECIFCTVCHVASFQLQMCQMCSFSYICSNFCLKLYLFVQSQREAVNKSLNKSFFHSHCFLTSHADVHQDNKHILTITAQLSSDLQLIKTALKPNIKSFVTFPFLFKKFSVYLNLVFARYISLCLASFL